MTVRAAALIVGLASAIAAAAPGDTAVRVWQSTITLPTYEEGPPNRNPPFDLFAWGRFNYPYTMRDALTDRRAPVVWRSLHLENEYLRLTVLPDLGGRIYSCLDKRTSREMFYANPSIKKALIGYRGAWSAFGVEFNFPVSHNWVSMSPVDFALTERPDGGGSVWIANTDLVYGGRWRVELTLRPGQSRLEQQVALANVSDVRHRYYWWSNAAVQVRDDSQLVYPTSLMATHGFTRIEPWPVDASGRDLSVIRHQTDGPVSLFTYGTREGFVGVYHPATSSGTVHVASPAELPVHKVWSWGADREALAWREALSDDHSAYIELQAGLFRNQETYGFLEPQETVQFVEHWLPVRDLGGITRATTAAVLHMTRPVRTKVRIALDVTRPLPGARIIFRQGTTVIHERGADLSPREVFRTDLDASIAPVSFEVRDADGIEVIAHTEGAFDVTPAADARVGPQADPGDSGPVDVEQRGVDDELDGRRLVAMGAYRQALAGDPGNTALLKAAGRLSVALGWPEAGARESIDWLTAAYVRNTSDAETRYYLGLALAGAGRPQEARPHFEAAARFRATRPPALLSLARLDAGAGLHARALAHITDLIASGAVLTTRAAGVEVALLRRLGRDDEARVRVRHWLAIDPADSFLRVERTLLGEADEPLWTHLAADGNRVLDVVDRYLELGDDQAALMVLSRPYPAVISPMQENGVAAPEASPLVACYRGFVRARAGGGAEADYRLAESLPTDYVFPARRSSYAVLKAALQADPKAAHARFLLGALYLASGLTGPAIESWEQVRRTRPAIATLHRNLGLALLHESGDLARARAVLDEGLGVDGGNVELYLTLDRVLSALDVAPAERVAALRRYPASVDLPTPLTFTLALALADAGEAAAAERLFHERFFAREEGGTSVRAVYANVQTGLARRASRERRCDEALRRLDALGAEQPGLPFTTGGLGDLLNQRGLALQAADVESACGRRDQARARWQRLARGASAGDALTLATADIAAARLGQPPAADRRSRLEAALAQAGRALETGATSNPGAAESARALLLHALGRPVEARAAIRRAFQYPDRNLSHALARYVRDAYLDTQGTP